jgi:glutamate synthase (NADPH/NADH) small chain
MDAARTALRLGADEVTVVYRRTRAEMPARSEELTHAEEEGIIFKMLTSPIKVLGENGIVTGLKCVKTELGEPDASGRRSPVDVVNSEFIIPCDEVIMAIGTRPNPILAASEPRLLLTKRGTIAVNDDQITSIPNIYAGGDASTGAATVILAMGAGRAAAKSIIAKASM